MTISERILQSLILMCRENEIIPADIAISGDDDMFEYGVIDSMGLTILSYAIEEHFGLPVTQEMLIAELRTPRAIAEHIAAYIMENDGVNTVANPA